MPASSFVLAPSFVWPPPPPPAEVRAPALRAKPRDRARVAKLLRGTKPRRKRSRGRLSQQVLTTMIDRLEVAVAAGRIDLHDDATEESSIAITTGELALLLQILFPEEWPALAPASRGVSTAPGSAARIADYAARASTGEKLYHPLDACPVRGDVDGRLVAASRLALLIVQRANGSGPKVEGWAEVTSSP